MLLFLVERKIYIRQSLREVVLCIPCGTYRRAPILGTSLARASLRYCACYEQSRATVTCYMRAGKIYGDMNSVTCNQQCLEAPKKKGTNARVARPFTKHGEGVHTQRGDDSANGRGEHTQQTITCQFYDCQFGSIYCTVF